MIERIDITTSFVLILAISAGGLAFLQDHSLPLHAFEVSGMFLTFGSACFIKNIGSNRSKEGQPLIVKGTGKIR